jgi:tRNA uridine 5-carboxymethylaminomethyl modification enzyme
VQIEFYKTIPGLENVKITRNAYAIEYDCIDPISLTSSLEFRNAENLYGAGQFNGSSGYEEAAAQGLVAGINAARKIKGLEPIVLSRSESYIGTLIDDLVTKGCQDPYRIMTSRSEYRLVLRQDNADERLMPIGYENGLISEEKWQAFLDRKSAKEAEIARLEKTFVAPSDEINLMLEEKGTVPLTTGARLADLIRRPQIKYADLEPFDNQRPTLSDDIAEKVEVEIKYDGYINRQLSQIAEVKRLENREIPKDIDYNEVYGLRLEAIEKLNKVRPENIGQASRISGVSPADISVLIIHFEKKKGLDKK